MKSEQLVGPFIEGPLERDELGRWHIQGNPIRDNLEIEFFIEGRFLKGMVLKGTGLYRGYLVRFVRYGEYLTPKRLRGYTARVKRMFLGSELGGTV